MPVTAAPERSTGQTYQMSQSCQKQIWPNLVILPFFALLTSGFRRWLARRILNRGPASLWLPFQLLVLVVAVYSIAEDYSTKPEIGKIDLPPNQFPDFRLQGTGLFAGIPGELQEVAQ